MFGQYPVTADRDQLESERDEWRGYFDRMLERLHRLGYTPERNPWSILLED